MAFLLAYQPQTGEVRAEILGLLRAASAQNDHRAQVTAAMIEGGVSPREAFRQQLALSNDDVYRWIAEKWRQERVDGDESAAPPAVVESVAPAYPAELVAEQMDGAVTVRFFVGEDGTVADPCVIASDHPAFSAAALEALAKWRFRPGIKDGKPVATRMQIDFPFSVRK